LEQYKNKVWNFVKPSKDKAIIGAKWVFRNNLYEQGKVVMNMARLVAKGYSH